MKLIKSILIVAVVTLSSVSAMAQQQQKFAVVSAQELLAKMPEMDSVQIKMEKIQQTLLADMEATEKEYTAKVQDFQKNVSSYSETIRAQKEKDIQSIRQRLEEFRNVAQQEVSEQYQLLMTPVQKRLLDAIQKVGKEGGFIFVFDTTSALYVSETLVTDITPLVKTAVGIK